MTCRRSCVMSRPRCSLSYFSCRLLLESFCMSDTFTAVRYSFRVCGISLYWLFRLFNVSSRVLCVGSRLSSFCMYAGSSPGLTERIWLRPGWLRGWRSCGWFPRPPRGVPLRLFPRVFCLWRRLAFWRRRACFSRCVLSGTGVSGYWPRSAGRWGRWGRFGL